METLGTHSDPAANSHTTSRNVNMTKVQWSKFENGLDRAAKSVSSADWRTTKSSQDCPPPRRHTKPSWRGKRAEPARSRAHAINSSSRRSKKSEVSVAVVLSPL